MNRTSILKKCIILCSSILVLLLSTTRCASAQGTVRTFQFAARGNSYTLVGRDPGRGGTTIVPTVIVPIALSFESRRHANGPFSLSAAGDVPHLLRSPVFSRFPLPAGGTTQYVDAMLRATFPKATDWHTILGKPEVLKSITITVPADSGYMLTSKSSGRSAAVADIEYVERELFKQIPKQDGKLIVALTHNTTYYTEGDATICCSWGTHGVDAATGASFVLASYLSDAPEIVKDQDVQPLTQQLAEFIYDPLRDPLVREGNGQMPGNQFPEWLRPAGMRPGDQGRCGGQRVASPYFLLEPTDTNRKNNFPESVAFVARRGRSAYHLQNVALLSWYVGAAESLGAANSFPDTRALTEPAKPCPARRRGSIEHEAPATKPVPTSQTAQGSGHRLIGYWTGEGPPGSPFPLSSVSPQWDVIIVAFATPVKNAPEGTLNFQPPTGLDPEQLKRDIANLKSQEKKVMISLGGGGQYFTLDDPKSIPTFVSCVARIVRDYGFDGIDIDFETPSLVIARGDTDFRHPTTPSIVNLIAGLRQLREDLGPTFMISLVPEGTQIPAGHVTYGGQFGSYLPIAYGIRDILWFMDVQDYNTPPLQALDGEIYQAGSVDYHAAMTELVLQGFEVGNDSQRSFPSVPAQQLAVGFLTGETTPLIVSAAMEYLITGKTQQEVNYRLLKPGGYPGMIGAMFWTIDADRRENYRFSNVIGPQLHNHPKRD